MQEGEDGAWETTPCDHLAFIFVNEVSEFEYMAPDFEERFDKVSPAEMDDDDDEHWHYETDKLPALLSKAGYGQNLVIFERTCGGMACGPVWYTDLFAFDWEKMIQESEE